MQKKIVPMHRLNKVLKVFKIFADTYHVDQSKLSVSGISSGAAMATQLHVIFSRHFMGAGIIAGGK